MGAISGQDSKLQIGKETTWGTAVAPTVQIGFTSESLKYVQGYIEEDVMVGLKTTGRMDISGKKVEGDFSMIVKPDNIGLLLAAALGNESSANGVGATSTVYEHSFSCLASGTSNSLPKLTIVVDRHVAVKGYKSCKINQLTLEAAVNDYLRATFSVRGHSEADDAVESLSYSTKRAFQFIDGNITVDGSNYADITNFRLTVNNNLENDLFTMDSSTYMQEIEPQKREITIELEALYSSSTNTTREDNFLAGATAAINIIFTSTEEAAESEYYLLTIKIPLAYITDASPNVGGPERIKQTLVCKASENASNEPITIVLQDLQTTRYLA